ncbi:MAG TPA: FG-GAP-like repeat-containing protein [Planctomycetota bacterium]|nr:FG-GAP-like repeat-containing protein [Planctomycetota bacterium]
MFRRPMSLRTRLAALVLLPLLLPLAGCGAGLITGIVASNKKNNPPEARVPELSVSPVLPLVPAAGTVRTVVVANAQIAAAARLRVQIEAMGIGIDQENPSASGQGGATLISFTLDTAAIVAAVADPTAADIEARLSVFVDDSLVASPVAILLARQPQTELMIGTGMPERFLSPLGERVSVRVAGLRSSDAESLQLFVTTLDPLSAFVGGEPRTVTRLCTDLQIEQPEGADPIVSAFVPGSTFPTRAQLFVVDVIAGISTTVDNAYYRPDIVLALPRQGPTTGGSLLTLIGTALVPYDFSAGSAPVPFKFDDVELSFEKGERVTRLSATDFRIAESGSDRLVFTMPASPDGRPGQVDIILRIKLGDVTAQVTASQVFLFANPDPFFGPRGAVLERLPVTVAPIALDHAPSTEDAPDFVALTDQGGVAYLQLLLAQQNGMFQRFAAPRQIGDHEVLAERGPRDLCIGDFDGDHVPDVFIANEGAGTAVHHLVLGQKRPDPPLGVVHGFAATAGFVRCRSAFFDADGLPDILLVPGPNAPPGSRPQVWLARPLGQGQPAFAAPMELPVRDFPYEAVEVADLDGDGKLDVAVASGSTLQLDVAYGRGDGTFETALPLDFSISGYTPAPLSRAVGLHACGDGTSQSLGLVLSGLPGNLGTGPTPPTLTLLRHDSSPGGPLRSFLPPDDQESLPVASEPLALSLAANLDQQGPIELVVAAGGEPALASLGLVRLGPSGFELVLAGIEAGGESPKQIRALVYDRAFPATLLSGEAKAVFIVHESDIDGGRERRLSTRLIVGSGASLKLLPPDAGDGLPFPIANLVGGNFHERSVASGGAVRDLALVQQQPDQITLVENDGFGGFPKLSNRLASPGLLPGSVTLLPAPPNVIDRLLFCGSDSRLGVWQHVPCTPEQCVPVQVPNALTSPLRDLIQDPALATSLLTDRTRMLIGDVDGDGTPDLVMLLSFDLPAQGEGDARLALLRGKPAFGANEFPFFEPTTLTPVHGNASSIALGDFASAGPGQSRQLELAVAVPVGTTPGAADGDHLRFFRYVAGATPAEDRFVPSALPNGPQVLLAGSAPTLVTAGDFDRDGLVDLLVACAADSTLRMFRNTAASTSTPGDVDVAAFHEDLTSPRQLAPGVPTVLRLSDVNGDASLDAVVFVEFTSPQSGQTSTTVATYLSSSAGEFVGPRFASPTRIGPLSSHLSGDLGDWNRDGVPDLFLGWGQTGVTNLRVLFGGTR